MKRMIGLWIAALFLGTTNVGVSAPLSYDGTGYVQDFDGLPTNVSNPVQTLTGKGPHEFTSITSASGIDGWQFANPSGSSANTEFRSQDGSLSGSSGRGSLSLGVNGSTERALGALSTSNQIPVFGLVLRNDSGLVIDSFTLSYTGEQWRRGDVSTANKLLFAYSVGGSSITTGTFSSVPSLDFLSPNMQVAPTNVALDGNLVANQASITDTVTNISWLPGETLVLRWTAQDLSGQDNALGIDDVSFSTTAVPEASTVLLCVFGVAGVVTCGQIRRRFSAGAALKA